MDGHERTDRDEKSQRFFCEGMVGHCRHHHYQRTDETKLDGCLETGKTPGVGGERRVCQTGNGSGQIPGEIPGLRFCGREVVAKDGWRESVSGKQIVRGIDEGWRADESAFSDLDGCKRKTPVFVDRDKRAVPAEGNVFPEADFQCGGRHLEVPHRREERKGKHHRIIPAGEQVGCADSGLRLQKCKPGKGCFVAEDDVRDGDVVDDGKRHPVAFDPRKRNRSAAEGGRHGRRYGVSRKGGRGDYGGQGIELEVECGERDHIGLLPGKRDRDRRAGLAEALEIFQDDREIDGGRRG